MIKAVLFDMDGTLLDTERISRESWRRAMDAEGVCVDVGHFCKSVSGMTMDSIRAYCMREYGTDFPFDVIRAKRRDFLAEAVACDGTLRKAGVPGIFPVLKRMGIKLAVASSSREDWVRKCLGTAGVDVAFFDCLMTGEKVERSKPDPEIFLKAAAILGVTPEECVVAEDSANGVRAGHTAGMKTVMIPDLMPCADELRPLLWDCIDSLEMLPALIEKFNRESEIKA